MQLWKQVRFLDYNGIDANFMKIPMNQIEHVFSNSPVIFVTVEIFIIHSLFKTKVFVLFNGFDQI